MSEPAICVPVAGATEKEILAQAEMAVAERPDLLEWRVDFFSERSDLSRIGQVLAALKETAGERQILFTLRTKPEGGEADLSPAEYARILRFAAGRPEVGMVDLEGLRKERPVDELIECFLRAGIPTIASAHFFDRTPSEEEMVSVFCELEEMGADILKLAVMAETEQDVSALVRATTAFRGRSRTPVIAIAMGEAGTKTRALARRLGSVVTFASVAKATAPGQISVKELRKKMAEERRTV